MFLNIFNNAKAHIKGGENFPNINGIIRFKEVKDGVLLTVDINGLPQSKDQCKRKFLWFSYT